MGLGCNYVLLDAQTIQMVKVDEALGNKGSLGRQFIMQAVAQVLIRKSSVNKQEWLKC